MSLGLFIDIVFQIAFIADGEARILETFVNAYGMTVIDFARSGTSLDRVGRTGAE